MQEKIPAYSWYALGLLTLVYLLNFLDRSLIYILFPLIKKDMALSNLQLALLGTTSFVIFYTLLGIPFGRMADRVVRKNLIAIGLAVWSLFSGLTGFADSFWTIFFCRVMVGVGEATLGPAALSLLSDYFPLRLRASVQAIYSIGIPLGSSMALFLGGRIGQELGWQWAFYLLGFPGLIVAVVVFFLKEVPRGHTETIKSHYSSKDWSVLLKSVPLLYHHVGYALFALASYSIGIWGALFFPPILGMDLKTFGYVAGTLSLISGVPVTILGGYVADYFRRRGKHGRMLFTASIAFCCVPLWLILLNTTNLFLLLVAGVLLSGLSLIWLGPAAADVHEIAGPQLRGLGVGIYFFTVNIIGYGIGPPVVGKLNDWLGTTQNPSQMKYSLLICPIACVLSSLFLWLGSNSLREDSMKLEKGSIDL
ncbi:MAG: MFS transporter [Blastocatellia bacterium]|nr:MFS transporter [Blastocatellia bacterium]